MRATEFNWPTGIFLISYHLGLLIGLPLYFMHYSPTFGMWATTILLFFCTGMSITAGYHRYYSHSSYKAHPVVEFFLLFFGSMAVQGSALRWSYEHRLHHAFVDTDKDPYSIKRGFWYAHILWLFEKPREIEKKIVNDLTKNRLVMFQHNYYVTTMIVTNLIAFFAVGVLLGDFMGAFVLAVWTRLFFLHHSTWFINSLCHTWGARTFGQEQSAVDNYIISFLTFGEGYHNYHHTFATDYRNGVRWFHYDPTKWLIWGLNRLGLAYSLKRINKYHVKERIVQDHKNELLEVLKTSFTSRKEELCETVSTASQEISNKLSRMRELLERARQGGKSQECPKEKSKELKTLKKGLREDWKRFRSLYKNIMRGRLSSLD